MNILTKICLIWVIVVSTGFFSWTAIVGPEGYCKFFSQNPTYKQYATLLYGITAGASAYLAIAAVTTSVDTTFVIVKEIKSEV